MKTPVIPASAYVASNAVLAGDVRLGEACSVFFHAVLRADLAPITVGDGTNIQDGCVLHENIGVPVSIGADCTIGHGALLHGCTIGDHTLIGMGVIVLNGAVIGSNCIVGAGALVTKNTVIPDGSLVLGNPAKVKRPLTDEELLYIREAAEEYRQTRLLYMGRQAPGEAPL